MFDCCGSGSVCCSRLRPEAHQKQPQKQPFPLRGEVGGGGGLFLTAVAVLRSLHSQLGSSEKDTAKQTPRDTPNLQSSFGMTAFTSSSAWLWENDICHGLWDILKFASKTTKKKLSESCWLPRRIRHAWHAAGKHPCLCTGSSSGSPASRLDSFWLHLVSQGMDLPIVQFITGLALLIKVQEGG